MTGEQMMELARARREAQGFRLEWFIPSDNRSFTAYAKDETQKRAWLADAEVKGWVLQ